jgi:acyl transferase domain-containing protein
MSTVTYQPRTATTTHQISASAARPLPMSANAAQRLAAVYRLILDRAAETDALHLAGHELSAIAHTVNIADNRHPDGTRDLVTPVADTR